MANSLAHTKWVCKYHIVFTPKYRRKIIYYELREDIQKIIKDLCKWKGVEMIEGHYNIKIQVGKKPFIKPFSER